MYQLAKAVLTPYTLLSLVMAAGLIGLWRRGRESRWRLWLITAPLVVALLMSLPVVSDLAYCTLESRLSPITELPEDTDALVVLSGGIIPRDGKHPSAILAEDTLYRCLHAAELYHKRGRCLVVLSGGTVDPGIDAPLLSHAMRDLMLKLGAAPDDLIVEDRSTTTFENAIECQKLLDERSLSRIVLVTEACHMLRARACFTRLGLTVTPAPCQFVTGDFQVGVSTFVPSAGAARGTEKAVYEWLGLAWYWLHGRI